MNLLGLKLITKCCAYTMLPNAISWYTYRYTKSSSKSFIFFAKSIKWANPSLFYHLFSSFQKLITIFTTNKCEKCPSSIRSRDLNSQLLEHESTPITIRPGLPPKVFQILTTSRWLLSKWLKYFLCKIFQSAWEKNESSLKLHNT